MKEKPDSLIFDMDGTLWDALDTYVNSWNIGLIAENVDRVVSREEISSLMGIDSQTILNTILPSYTREEQHRIFDTINVHRAQQVEAVGGTLYEGVVEGLQQLSKKYKLFIVSNCPAGMISLFTKWANIDHLIIDEMAYGVNNMPKSYNIKYLIEKHQLKRPVYIGDTEHDRLETELAGIPFVFFSFGFGYTDNYHLKFDDFKSFTQYFLDL